MSVAATLALWLVLLVPLPLGLLAQWRPPRYMRSVVLAAAPLPLVSLWLLPAAGEGGLAGSLTLAGLTLHWRLDPLAALLLLLTQLVLLACAAYAVGHRRAALSADARHSRLWPLLGGLAVALGLIWVAADLLLLYVGLELMGLTAVGMMLLPGQAEAIRAGLRYLLYALVGSLAWLLGVALLLGARGTLELSGLAAAEPDAVARIAMALLAGGLLLKAAIFPLHGWLAPVHASAWTPVSAVHGALVVKASFFILVILWRLLLPEAVAAAWALGLLGASAVLWGGLKAWRADTLKQVVAWSTVGQLGYLMLTFPLLAAGASAVATLAWQATWLQLAGHALAKAAMFMAAGNLMFSTGASRLEDLANTSRRLPLSLMTFGVAAVTLMGLPPSAGFTAKWLLLQSALAAQQWLWVAVLVLGTLLTAAYVFRVLRYSFMEASSHHDFRPLPRGMDLTPLLLALAAVGLGLAAEWPMALLRQGGVP